MEDMQLIFRVRRTKETAFAVSKVNAKAKKIKEINNPIMCATKPNGTATVARMAIK
jgi:flagellar hook-associated protein FlgK